ncbi:MAG: YtxH domain-containing protein [Arcobacteraceae bacterium]|jgi:hypothetical protein|nr:YtxH domain-containing protein [Arcobacteraceae bacterium]
MENKTNPYINTQNTANTMPKNPYINTATPDSILGAFDTKNFLVGAVIGVLGTYILTNENAQKTIFKTIAGGSQMFQAGIEELKERYEDAKAELEASKQ